jgi:hypothetical protein
MARKNKTEQLADEISRGLLEALALLETANDADWEPGTRKDTWLTGYGFTAAQARKLEGYGCVKVTGQQKIGLGHRLEVKITALGRRVAESVG